MNTTKLVAALAGGLAAGTMAVGLATPAYANTCNDGAVQRGGSGGDYYFAMAIPGPTSCPPSIRTAVMATGQSTIAAAVCEVSRPVHLRAVGLREASLQNWPA